MEFKHEKIDGGVTDYYSVVGDDIAVSLMVLPEAVMGTKGMLVYHREVPAGYGGSGECDHFPYCNASMTIIPEDAPLLTYTKDEIRDFLTDKMEKVMS